MKVARHYQILKLIGRPTLITSPSDPLPQNFRRLLNLYRHKFKKYFYNIFLNEVYYSQPIRYRKWLYIPSNRPREIFALPSAAANQRREVQKILVGDWLPPKVKQNNTPRSISIYTNIQIY